MSQELWICHISLYKDGVWISTGATKEIAAKQAWYKLIEYASEDGKTLPTEYVGEPNITFDKFMRDGFWDGGEALCASLHRVDESKPTYLFDNGRI